MDRDAYKRHKALREQGIARGAPVRAARFDAADLRGRSAAEVFEKRRQAAKSASLCADCFAPLSPDASVTMVSRRVSYESRARSWEFPRQVLAPICLPCWLDDLQREAEHWHSQLPGLGDQHCGEGSITQRLRRFRCGGCGRPMRSFGLPVRSRRGCCDDCRRKVYNEYYRLRRRVRHQKRPCAACGEPFMPKRSDAVTCSNKCRQRLFRQHARAPV